MRYGHKVYESGFTLIELVVVLLILALILIAVPASFRGSTQVWDRGDRHAEALQNGLIGMEQMVRELRQAQSLTTASSSGYIQFNDRDGNLMDFGKSVTSPEYVQQDSVDLAGPIEDDSLRFTYYKGDGTTTADPSTQLNEIRSVLIQINMVDGDRDGDGDSDGKINDIPISSRVNIRNLDILNPPPDGGPDFAIFGIGGVYLKNGGFVDGNVGSNGDIYLRNLNEIGGETIHGGSLDYQNEDTILVGPNYTMHNRIPCPTDVTFTGGPPVTSTNSDPDDVPEDYDPLDNGNTRLQAGSYDVPGAGSYGVLDIANGKTLYLESGDYYFESFSAGNNLTIDIDLSVGEDTGGGVRIFIEGQVNIGTNLVGSFSEISGGGPDDVYFETHYGIDTYYGTDGEILPDPDTDAPAWQMGQGAVWRGTIYAPYDDIGTYSSNITAIDLEGSLYSGRWVYMMNSSRTVYVASDYLTRDTAYDCYQ